MQPKLTNPALDPAHREPVTMSVREEWLEMTPEERRIADGTDGIQHGLDDDPNHDAAKGSALGAAGGAAVGAAAGAILGPAGIAVGALAGAAIGAAASGLAVAAVDAVDNDGNITGIGAEVAARPKETLPDTVQDKIRLNRIEP